MPNQIDYTQFDNPYQIIAYLMEKEELQTSSEESTPAEEKITALEKKVDEQEERINVLSNRIEDLRKDRTSTSEEDSGASDEEPVSEEESGDEGGEEEPVECPTCGEEMKPLDLATHMRRNNDHPTLSYLFKNSTGNFECVLCEDEFDTARKFATHTRSAHDVIPSIVIRDKGVPDYSGSEESVEDTSDDGEGSEIGEMPFNGLRPSDMSMERRVNEFERAAMDADKALTTHEMIKKVFGKDYEASTPEYDASYKALAYESNLQNKKLNIPGKRSTINVFADTEQKIKEKESEVGMEHVKDKYGENRLSVLKMVLSKVLPDVGDTLEFTDFAEEFPGDREMSSKDVWLDIMTNSSLREAVFKDVDEDLNLTCVNQSNSQGPRSWSIRVDSK